MDLFKKSTVVGVSITPNVGLEIAEIDFAANTVVKYGTRPLEYNQNKREIADLDKFKDSLQDLLDELEIPKGTEIVLNVPNVFMKVSDYPASMEQTEVSGVIEDELNENYRFKDNEASYSMVKLPSMSIQFNKIAYCAVHRNTLVELILFIKDLGYKIRAIDTSINSTLNAMVYTGRINTDTDTNWLMMVVESSSCTVMSMQGNSYIDIFEEKISIGEVLGDEENYATIIKAVGPILKNIPAKYLFVLSKTDIVSAEGLANKLTYSSPITYQEANKFSKELLIGCTPEIDENIAKTISPDIIGAAIWNNFLPYSVARFNLYNRQLGDIYLSDQPPVISIGDREIVLSNQFLTKLFIVIAIIFAIITTLSLLYLVPAINKENQELDKLNTEIEQINKFLEENNNISTNLFDEGIEIRTGIEHNKAIYSYYTIVGTEIPQKLWLTHLKLSNNVTIDGQADNLESIYGFFRSIKDYNPDSNIKLQKLGLAANSESVGSHDVSSFDTASILTSMNADYYEFRISNEPEIGASDIGKKGSDSSKSDDTKLPDLEPINE